MLPPVTAVNCNGSSSSVSSSGSSSGSIQQPMGQHCRRLTSLALAPTPRVTFGKVKCEHSARELCHAKSSSSSSSSSTNSTTSNSIKSKA
ncbi:hypothetical protein AWZ03_014081 [Drosophila navojoa]|uniref:Uncharacterized protein n=1 Tax=Drosophila navojoa TaxID=7232 RepID=A0A484AS45_DRONA|nr:hypothetical protein AWZ03_014081 [Drosophila navojoa]